MWIPRGVSGHMTSVMSRERCSAPLFLIVILRLRSFSIKIYQPVGFTVRHLYWKHIHRLKYVTPRTNVHPIHTKFTQCPPPVVLFTGGE